MPSVMEAAMNSTTASSSFSPLMAVNRVLDSTQMSTGMLRMRTSVMEFGRFTRLRGPGQAGLVRLCACGKGEAMRERVTPVQHESGARPGSQIAGFYHTQGGVNGNFDPEIFDDSDMIATNSLATPSNL